MHYEFEKRDNKGNLAKFTTFHHEGHDIKVTTLSSRVAETTRKLDKAKPFKPRAVIGFGPRRTNRASHAEAVRIINGFIDDKEIDNAVAYADLRGLLLAHTCNRTGRWVLIGSDTVQEHGMIFHHAETVPTREPSIVWVDPVNGEAWQVASGDDALDRLRDIPTGTANKIINNREQYRCKQSTK